MTIAERIREEGRLMERQGFLLHLLKKRFGDMTPVLEQKLTKSGLDVLGRFGESIFDFKSLKDAEDWWDKFEKHGNA